MKLYYIENCPFCKKVLNFLDTVETGAKNNIEMINVNESGLLKEELITVNEGVYQVPCLVIDGKPLLESDSIIEYLSKKL